MSHAHPREILYFGQELNQLLLEGSVDEALSHIRALMLESAPSSIRLPTTPQLRFLYSYALLPACLTPNPGRKYQYSQLSYSQQIHAILRTVMELVGILPPGDAALPSILADTTKLAPDLIAARGPSSTDRSFDPVYTFYSLFDIQFQGELPAAWQMVDPRTGDVLDSRSPGKLRKNSTVAAPGGRRKPASAASTGTGFETESIGGRLQERSASRRAKKDIVHLYSLGSNLARKTDTGSGSSGGTGSFDGLSASQSSFEGDSSTHHDAGISEFDDEFEMQMLNFDGDQDVDVSKYKYEPKYSARESGLGETPGYSGPGSSKTASVSTIKFDDLLFTWPTLKLNLGFIGWILQYDSRENAYGAQRFAQLRPQLDMLLAVLDHDIEAAYALDPSGKLAPPILHKWISAESSPRKIATLVIANEINVTPATALTFRAYLLSEEIAAYEKRQAERDEEDDAGPTSTPQRSLTRLSFSRSMDHRIKLMGMITKVYRKEKDQAIFFDVISRRLIEHLTPETLYSFLSAPGLPRGILAMVSTVIFGKEFDMGNNEQLVQILEQPPDVMLENDSLTTMEIYMVVLKAVLIHRQEQQERGPAEEDSVVVGTPKKTRRKRAQSEPSGELDYEELRQAATKGKEARRQWLRAADKKTGAGWAKQLAGHEAELAALLT